MASPELEQVPAYLPAFMTALRDGRVTWANVYMECTICTEPLLVGDRGEHLKATAKKRCHPERSIILTCGHILGKRCFGEYVRMQDWDPDQFKIVRCPLCRVAVSYNCAKYVAVPFKWRPWPPCMARPYCLPRTAEALSRIPSLPGPHRLHDPCGRCREKFLWLSISHWANEMALRAAIFPDYHAVAVVEGHDDGGPIDPVDPQVGAEIKDPHAIAMAVLLIERWQKRESHLGLCLWDGTCPSSVLLMPSFRFVLDKGWYCPSAGLASAFEAAPAWNEVRRLADPGYRHGLFW